MRTFFILGAIAFGMAATACGGGSKSVPTPTSTPVPSALEIWARSQAGLDRVQSVRMQRDMSQDDSNVREDVIFPRGGAPSNPDYVPWRSPELLPAFPPLGYSSDTRPPSYTNVRLVGEELIDGKPHWGLSQDGIEGGNDTVRYFTAKVWIDKQTYLIRRVEDRTTRGEGCCGAPLIGLNAVIDYIDYQTGASTPVPPATSTPSSLPGTLTLAPTSGPCDGAVTLTGHGFAPYAQTGVYVQPSSVSERGDVEGTQLRQAYADERGDVSIQFQLADPWCAAPDVMIWHAIQVHVQVSTPDDVQLFDLQYEVSPCLALRDLASVGRQYCFNPEGPLTPSPPPPTISP
jgi:hypothetical protein